MFVFKLIAGVIANVAIFGAPLFLLAGTWDWWRAWVLLGAVLIGTVVSVMTLPRDLLEERLKPPVQKGQPLADKIVLILLVVMFTALIVFIPLDVFRFQLLTKPNESVSWLGLILFASGWWIAYLALKQNPFAAPVVKHQTEREQVVIDTGVYRIVRHPMYSGGALLMVGMPLWLESYAAALFAIVPVTALIIRILFEEEFLKRELKGYQDYIVKIRYRLIPFVW
jgi:protein-S-isoprenylcysteine O-methyltransferase Ste14